MIELCLIESFDFAEGHGTLVTRDKALVRFDVGVFRRGAYRPTVDEARAIGTARSPVLPRPGEVVAVVWRDDLGDVPESVTRIAPPAKRFTLTEWLAGVNERTDLLDGITAREVRAEPPFETRRGRVFSANDASALLKRVREVEQLFDEAPEPWVGWVDEGDRLAWQELADLLALEELPEAERPDFASWVDALNEAAEGEGIELRLFEIEAEAGERFVVALEPDQYEALEAEGYVRSPLAPEAQPRGASSLEEARAWLGASFAEAPGGDLDDASTFDLVAASRRIFKSVCAGRGFDGAIEPGPPDRFVLSSKDDAGSVTRVVFMFQEIEERGRRAYRFRFVDRDGETILTDDVDDVLRELDDRAALERVRFASVADLEAHLGLVADDWSQTVAGLRLTHEAIVDEGIWLSTTDTGGEEWIELTVGVTDRPVDADAVLEAASIASVVSQRQGESLELRATLPLSVVTGARLLELVDLLVTERAYLLDELFGEEADGAGD